MESNQVIQLGVLLLWTLLFIPILPMVHADHLVVNQTRQACPRQLTYEQIKTILKQHPCISVEDLYDNNNNSTRRVKRFLGGGDNQINALSSIINDHRTMINYMMNTSVNATFVKDSISDHHEKIGSNLRSWRGIIDLLCVIVIIGAFLYILIFRCGFGPCNIFLSSLSKLCAPRVEQKQQIQKF